MKRFKGLLILLIVMIQFSYALFAQVGSSICNDFDFPKPKNGNTYVIAHRGAHNNIPENSIAAYRKAIELGCDFLEVDIRRTKDCRFISIHNSTVDAYTNNYSGSVSEFTLAELKQISIGEKFGKKWEDERIPTFEEILKLCKGKIGIYLDLKEPYVNELIKIVKQFNMEKEILWYVPYSYKKEISTLKNNCEDCIPMPDPDFEEMSQCITDFNPSIIAPVMAQFSKAYVTKAHHLSTKVFVDEKRGTEEEWQMILSFNADGIQTDNPLKLIQYLKKNK